MAETWQVNGHAVVVAVDVVDDPDTPLLYVLRDNIGLRRRVRASTARSISAWLGPARGPITAAVAAEALRVICDLDPLGLDDLVAEADCHGMRRVRF